jgi:hypothetical protein
VGVDLVPAKPLYRLVRITGPRVAAATSLDNLEFIHSVDLTVRPGVYTAGESS